jgi:uncharacterized protein YjiS (DUF1127 family)
MSTQFRFPRNFVRHDDLRLSSGGAIEHVEPKPKRKCGRPVFDEPPAPLRDSHIVLSAIDVLVTLHASFKKWRNHRLTLRALDDLDERQLHDIGVTRDGGEYRTLDGGTK